MELDITNCSAGKWKWFDTHAYNATTVQNTQLTGGSTEFVDYFKNHVSNGTVLLGVTMDEPTTSLGSTAKQMLKKAGVDIDGIGYRSMFEFALQKGYPHKTVYLNQSSQPSAISLSVKISGLGEY